METDGELSEFYAKVIQWSQMFFFKYYNSQLKYEDRSVLVQVNAYISFCKVPQIEKSKENRLGYQPIP